MNPLSLEQIVNEIEAGIANQTFTPTRAADLWNSLFEYREEGYLVWKKSDRKNPMAGKVAGWSDRQYERVKVDGRCLAVHRIVWEMFNGEIPQDKQIDHIDRNKRNNRLDNLRVVTISQNCQNRPVRSDNKSGATGIRWYKERNAYTAYVSVDKKLKHLGQFKSFEEAKTARDLAIRKYGYITSQQTA